MKIFNKALTFLLVATTLSMSSCKKKCDCPVPTPITLSKTALLINKKWQRIQHTEQEGNNTPRDLYAITSECDKDNYIIFSAVSNESTSGTIEIKVNIKCDENDEDDRTPWFFNSDQSEIISEGQNLKILELTRSIFKISFTSTSEGVATVETITYGAID